MSSLSSVSIAWPAKLHRGIKRKEMGAFWSKVFPPLVATLLAALVFGAFAAWMDIGTAKIIVQRMGEDLREIKTQQQEWNLKMEQRVRELERLGLNRANPLEQGTYGKPR